MSDDKRKNKPVYFSKQKRRDLALLAHAEQIDPLTGKQQNFSEYVKNLIEADMKRKQRGGNNAPGDYNVIDIENDVDEDYSIEVKDAMNSFL